MPSYLHVAAVTVGVQKPDMHVHVHVCTCESVCVHVHDDNTDVSPLR